MRDAALAKRALSHTPTAGATRKNHRHRVGVSGTWLSIASRQTQFVHSSPEQANLRLGQQLFTRAIHQPQPLFSVEGENCHVDFRHHRAQQSSRFQCAQTLLAQGLTKFVDFQHDFAQRVTDRGAPAAQ